MILVSVQTRPGGHEEILKKLSAAVLAALLTACGGVRPDTVPVPGALTIISWNMDAGRGDLERLIDAHAPHPYVLLLQEADGGELRQVAAARNLVVFLAPVRADVPGSRGNAIVSSLPLREGRRIALPAERQPRMAVAAEVEMGGVRLFVASAHLENRVSWWRGGLLSETARGRQAARDLPGSPGARPPVL
jgi:hypothetical protein